LYVIIHEVERYRIVVGVEYRPPGLDGKGPLEFIRRGLFGDIDHHVAFDPLLHGIDMGGPHPVVHEFVDGILQRLENLLVGALNLLAYHLYIAPEFLCSQKTRQQKQQYEHYWFTHVPSFL
jgi:hypothetical protein